MSKSQAEEYLLPSRTALVRRGRRLEYLTIAWNALEAFASLTAAALAGSIALFAFGVDSLIEVASAMALLWRLNRDATRAARDHAERISLRIVGIFFIVLSVYIVGDSISALVFRHAPDRSVLGIIVSCASLVVMPLLARSKRIVATGMASAALHADAKQTDLCAYLSGILLGGTGTKCTLWLVVGRSPCQHFDGTDHRSRGISISPWRALLLGRLPLNTPHFSVAETSAVRE